MKLLKPCEQVNVIMKLWSLLSEIQDVHGSCSSTVKFPSELTNVKVLRWLQKQVVFSQIIKIKS